jgi:hypothetical protein
VKGVSIPKGALIPTYVLLVILLLDMAAPGVRRYLLIDQFKEGIRYAFSPTPLVTVGQEGADTSASKESPSVLANVACTHPMNAYTSDCQPYGHIKENQ